MSNWKGTAVPNSGTIEKVYFNTNLSVEEVNYILDSINISYDITNPEDTGDNITEYLVLVDTSQSNAIIITKWTQDTYNWYRIDMMVNGVGGTVFDSDEGWKVNEQVFNIENVLNLVAQQFNGYELQNDKLSSLFSITPFTQSEDKNILMHPRNADGTLNKNVNYYPRTKVGNLLASNGSKFTMPNVTYKQGEWQGETVPNSGTIENVYVNTNLSYDDVVNLLSQLTYVDSHYYVFRGNGSLLNTKLHIGEIDYEGSIEYLILSEKASGSMTILFVTSKYAEVLGSTFSGWNPETPTNISFNVEVNSEHGLENDKLNSLFSITPFERSSGGLFETKEDGTPNPDKPIQTGISEERVNELIDLKITGWLGGES